MKITNTTKGDLGLSFETVVPAGGFIEIDKDALASFKASRVVEGWFASGALVESGADDGPKPEAVKRTRRKGK